MMNATRSTVSLAAVLALATGAAASPPVAEKRPVTDTYWGVSVVDDYQYLEDVMNPAVAEWARGQAQYTRDWLDSYPQREAILERIVELTHSESPNFYGLWHRGGKLFAIKRQPPKEQSFLVVFDQES